MFVFQPVIGRFKRKYYQEHIQRSIMTGTITIPGKSSVKFDVENIQNKETEKHIQRMIVAFLTSDTFGEDALQEWDCANIGN